MGVNPEPALCADDVSRLVPSGSFFDAKTAIAKTAIAETAPDARMHTIPDAGHNRSFSARRIATTLLVGLALAGPIGPSRAGDGTIAVPARSDLRPSDAPAEWGGAPITEDDDALLGSVARSQASLATPRIDDETLRFGDMSVPRAIVEAILHASETTGVDPVYMMALADKESSFDPTVKSSASSAQGLFQFVTNTWLEMVRDYGTRHGLAAEAAAVQGRGTAIGIADATMRKRVMELRNDPYVSGLMAGELIKRDRARIETRIGRELKTTELYLAHFLGTASAGKFLSLSAENPDTVARAAFGRAARANRAIFTAKDGDKRRSLTVAEVHERLDGMIDRRLNQYQVIAEIAAQATEDRGQENPVLDARLRLEDAADPALAPSLPAPGALH